MAVTQESRYRMHQRLDDVLGAESAATLMEHLPPTGWGDLATKHDLAHVHDSLSQRIDHLDEKLSARIDAVDTRIDALDEKLSARIDALETRIDALNDQCTIRFATMATKADLADRQTDMHKTLLSVCGGIIATNVALFSAGAFFLGR